MELFKTVVNIETALETAAGLEKQGRDFYKRKLSSTDDPALGEILSFLAAEEEKHLETYQNLLKKATGNELTPRSELSEEYRMYINMLVSEITIWLREEAPETTDQIIKTAMNLEKNTLLFFQEIKLLLTGRDYDIVDAICREEKGHIIKIAAFRKSRFDSSNTV